MTNLFPLTQLPHDSLFRSPPRGRFELTEKGGTAVDGAKTWQGCGSDDLAKILMSTDTLSVGDDGTLYVEGCGIQQLEQTYGSPLYVVSEASLRANFRRISQAFSEAWPGTVRTLYAIKANNNLAIRAILNSEGAGGDCFGLGEMYATFRGGADPHNVVLNGSNKTAAEIDEAVSRNIMINIDAVDEVFYIDQACRRIGAPVRANVRLKLAPRELDRFESDFFGVDIGHLSEFVEREKWGLSEDAAAALIPALVSNSNILLTGYHVHMGRIAQDPGIQRVWGAALGDTVVSLFEKTGFWPQLLNVGGGWARERDPESRSLRLNRWKIEDYARTLAMSLIQRLDGGYGPLPELWVEPGRYIVGSAAVLMGRVGTVKEDMGYRWINVDISTNDLPRIDSAGCAHYVFPATRMRDSYAGPATIVGPTCQASILGTDRMMPTLERGDLVVVLDAGMYAETTSNQYNGIPRPATVLVDGTKADLIKKRETVEDVFARHLIPSRFSAVT
jgi:diaminopimelate decarboxylase